MTRHRHNPGPTRGSRVSAHSEGDRLARSASAKTNITTPSSHNTRTPYAQRYEPPPPAPQWPPNPQTAFPPFSPRNDSTRLGPQERPTPSSRSHHQRSVGLSLHESTPGLVVSHGQPSLELRRTASRDSLGSRVNWSDPVESADEDQRHEPRHRRSRRLSSALKTAPQPAPKREQPIEEIFLKPIHNLRGYLASSAIEKFEGWPADQLHSRSRSMGRGSALENSFARLSLSPTRVRALRTWERNPRFKHAIVDDVKVHVPDQRLSKDERWGKLLFTVPAENYKTKCLSGVASVSPDTYLLHWLNETVLTSALSVLHTIRFRYLDAEFWTAPPLPLASLPSPPGTQDEAPAFVNGHGTLVLARANSNGASAPPRRAMLLTVLPPQPYSKEVVEELTCDIREWGKRTSRRDEHSQLARLLQAQMNDACVAHGVRCWVATTLKWWVFGIFTVDYSRCVVSPIIRRNQKECTVLQCLVTWMRIALEAEESDYSTPERKAERRQQRHAARISNDNRPPLQRIPIHSTSLRTTCTTRNAPEGSRRSRRRSISQPECPRPRSASSSRSQRRRGKRMTEGRAADANGREQYQESCHCTHTHTHTHITYVNTLYVQPVQFVSAVVAVPQNHPRFPPQW